MSQKAGMLKDKVTFDERIDANDGAGNFEATWQQRHTCAAEIRDLRGGENVVSARLSGIKPAIVMIRDCISARAITTGFRVIDVRRGTIYNVRDVTPSRQTGMIDLLCETGVAHG